MTSAKPCRKPHRRFPQRRKAGKQGANGTTTVSRHSKIGASTPAIWLLLFLFFFQQSAQGKPASFTTLSATSITSSVVEASQPDSGK